MARKGKKQQLIEAVEYLNKLLTKDATGVFWTPIVPGDCRSYDQATADYIRDERLRIYVKSWILPNIEDVINKL